MTVLTAILMFLAPGAVAAAVLLAVLPLVRREPEDRERPRPLLGRLAPPIAAALAFVPADIGLNQFHPIWDKDGTKRFLAVALAAGLVGLVHAAVARWPVAVVARALLGAAVAAAVLYPLAGGPYVPWPVFTGLVVATGVWLPAAGLVADASATPRLAAPVAMIVLVSAAAPGVFLSKYAGGAQYFGTLAAIAGGLAAACVFRASRSVDRSGFLTVWLALYGSVLLVTYGYAEVPSLWPLVVIAMAPFGLLAVRVGRKAWLSTLIAVLVAAALGGGATLAAGLAGGDDDGGDSYDYYEY